MPNAKDNALILDDISILVVGESGTGKSVFASTFPTPMFVFDFDKQIAAYGNKDIDYEQYEKSNAGWMKYEKDHADFLNGTICNKRQFKAVVIDSTSTLIDLAMERALALSPKRGAVPRRPCARIPSSRSRRIPGATSGSACSHAPSWSARTRVARAP